MNPHRSTAERRTLTRDHTLKALVLSSALLAFGLRPAQAEILVSDRFSYGDGPLVATTAAQWHTRTGTPGQIDVASGAMNLTEGESEVAEASLGGQASSAPALYAGFTVKFSALPSGSGAYFAAFNAGDSDNDDYVGRVFATTDGAAPGSLHLGISTVLSTPTGLAPLDLNLGTKYRVVVGYFRQGALLWVDPVSESEMQTFPMESTFPRSVTSIAFLQTVANGDGAGSLTVDDLVVATTFDEAKTAPPSVVPPSMESPKLAGGVFSVRASTQAGVSYILQRKFSPSDATWSPVATRTGTGGALEFTDNGATEASAIYRLRTE